MTIIPGKRCYPLVVSTKCHRRLTMGPQCPVPHMCHNVRCSHDIWYGVSSVFINTPQNKFCLLWSQEIILIREGRDEKPCNYSQRQGNEAFDDLQKHNAQNQNFGHRTLYKLTKIHLQPASFPLPPRRVQPYARIGPIAAAIKAIKYNEAMLEECSVIRENFWTVHWHTATEPRDVYTCEVYQLILQILIGKRFCCIPSRHDKQYWREDRCLDFIRWTTLLERE